METEGGGAVAVAVPERGKKRPPSPPTLGDDGDSSNSTTDDDGDGWFVSSSEEEDDQENEGIYSPFTVNDIPRPSCDHKEQSVVCYEDQEVKLRGPSPIWLYPAFKCDKHPFSSDYNLGDTSEISVNNVGDCPKDCGCWPINLLQFIDIKIAGYQHTHPGPAKIFGFIAAREVKEPLRNYVYKRDIENCEDTYVKERTGVARLTLGSPTRAISISTRALIEFKLHALSEDETSSDDGIIIEGCTELDTMFTPKSCIQNRRLYSSKCALDIKFAILKVAVEARVNIKVLRVPADGVNLMVLAKTSGFDDVIQLFKGSISESEVGVVMSFSVAVTLHKDLDLCIKGSPNDVAALGQEVPRKQWLCSLSANLHAKKELEAKLGEFAAFEVMITWKSYKKISVRR